MSGDSFKGKLMLIEYDLGRDGLAWSVEYFEDLDNFMRLRAEWEQYCRERGQEP